jgi:hypothetical protein
VVVVVDVEVVWAVEVVWVVEVVVNMVGGRRGGGRLGVVGVGDGRRRGGDRRGKVDAGGCRRVADVAWLGCGRCRVVDVARSTRGVVVVSSTWRGRGWGVVVVASSTWQGRRGGSSSCRRRGVVVVGCGRCCIVDVARSTRGVVVVSSTWRGRHGGSSSCRRCGVVMVGMWSWSLSPRRRGKVDAGGRRVAWREVVDVAVVIHGVVVVVHAAWGLPITSTWRGRGRRRRGHGVGSSSPTRLGSG